MLGTGCALVQYPHGRAMYRRRLFCFVVDSRNSNDLVCECLLPRPYIFSPIPRSSGRPPGWPRQPPRSAGEESYPKLISKAETPGPTFGGRYARAPVSQGTRLHRSPDAVSTVTAGPLQPERAHPAALVTPTQCQAGSDDGFEAAYLAITVGCGGICPHTSPARPPGPGTRRPRRTGHRRRQARRHPQASRGL